MRHAAGPPELDFKEKQKFKRMWRNGRGVRPIKKDNKDKDFPPRMSPTHSNADCSDKPLLADYDVSPECVPAFTFRDGGCKFVFRGECLRRKTIDQ